MAYREFYQKDPITQTDFSPIERGISNLFTGIAQRQKEQRTEAQKYGDDVKAGSWESDHKVLTEGVSKLKDAVVAAGGKPSFEQRKAMAALKSYSDLSSIQRKRADDLEKRINEVALRNKYYDPTPDFDNLYKLSSSELNAANRGQVIDQIENSIGSARNFKKDQYLADYVKDRQRSYKEKTTGSPDAKNTKFDESTFWDEKTGKPGVTDEHAVDAIKSDKMLSEQYDLELQDQMLDEISKMKASGDPKTVWMSGLSDAEIQNELINDPSKNLINSKNFGDRKREMAKADLKKFNAVNSKVSYERKEPTVNGNVTNDSIGHSETFFTDTTGPGKGGVVSGPGGLLMIKKGISAGKPIQIEADSGKAFDYRTGKNATRSKGKFNLTGYQLQPYTKNGDLYPVQGASFDEVLASVENLPDEVLRNMDPELKISLSGYELNDSKMLGDIATKSFDISERIGDETDPEKKAELEYQLSELNRLKQVLNAPGMYDDDIIQAAQKNGIKQVRKDQLLLADRSDLDKIKTITGGLDLKNKDQWNPEMKKLNEVYTRKWNEANQKTAPLSDTERGFDKKKKTYPLPKGTPRTVKQNGFTYTWNEQTGKHE
jgi:hypothetical protein